MWENELTVNELEVVTTVFKQFETGLREGRIMVEVGESENRMLTD